MDDAVAGMENALKANPKDIGEQYETQLRELREAYGEAMLKRVITDLPYAGYRTVACGVYQWMAVTQASQRRAAAGADITAGGLAPE